MTNSTSIGNSVHSIELEGTVIKCISGSKVQIDKAGNLILKQGEILVVADNDTAINIGNDIVKIQKDTVSVLCVEDGMIRVCNLYESKHKSISVEISGKRITVSAGEELLVASDKAKIRNKIQEGNVGRRRVVHSQLREDKNIAHSEISLISLMQDNNSQEGN